MLTNIGPLVVTNLAMPKCANAAPAYLRLIALTIATLSDLPNVNLYVDAAHSAWLGWPDVCCLIS